VKLIRLDGAQGEDGVWVNPDLVAAVESNGTCTIVVMVGCANPIKITTKGAPSDVAAKLSTEEA